MARTQKWSSFLFSPLVKPAWESLPSYLLALGSNPHLPHLQLSRWERPVPYMLGTFQLCLLKMLWGLTFGSIRTLQRPIRTRRWTWILKTFKALPMAQVWKTLNTPFKPDSHTISIISTELRVLKLHGNLVGRNLAKQFWAWIQFPVIICRECEDLRQR